MRNDNRLSAIYVTTEYPGGSAPCGGIGYHIQKLAREMSARGHDISVICLDEENLTTVDQGVALTRTVLQPGPIAKAVLKAFSFVGLKRYLRYILAAKHLEKTLRAHPAFVRADLIQYQSFLLAGFFRVAEKPAVCLLASVQWLCDKAADPVKRWYPSNLATALTEFLVLRRMDMIFAPSRFAADFVSRIIRRPILNIETPFVPFPHPLSGDLPDELKGKRIMLYFGSVCRLKGLDRFVPIAREILARHEDVVLVICGRDMNDSGATMAPIYEAAGPNKDRVVRFEHLGQDQLRTLITHANQVILPSRTDNCPQTCIESMGLGAIVLATTGASFEQVIVDGETGFLTPQDDADRMVQSVERILALPADDRARISAAAKARAGRMAPEFTVPALLQAWSDTVRSWRARNDL